jgi:hypothetical protein
MKRLLALLVLLAAPAWAQNSTTSNTVQDPASGGVAADEDTTFSGDNTFSGSNIFSGLFTWGTAAGAADSISANETAGCITGEGGDDANETRLCFGTSALGESSVTFTGQSNGLIMDSSVDAVFTGAADLWTFQFGAHIGTGRDLTFEGVGGVDFISTSGSLNHRTEPAPDGVVYFTGSDAESLRFMSRADVGALASIGNGPCGAAACTHPTLVIYADGASPNSFTSVQAGAIVGTMTKALTESMATDVVRIGVADGVGRGGVIEYTVFAADATERQTVGAGAFRFAVQNVGGTETCTMSPAAPDQTNDGSITIVTAGTLTYAWTCTSAVDATVDLELNAVSSLTQTTLKVDYVVRVYGPGTAAAQ